MKDLNKIAGTLVGLTVPEVNELIGVLRDEHGIEPYEVAVVAPVPTALSEEKEKTSFDVHLMETGPMKLKLIKEIKNIFGLPLRESKNLVDSAPVEIKTGIRQDEANEIKSMLESAGGVVEIR